MFNQFLQNIKEKQLFKPNHRILVAVSGGVDSMVLLHLFEKSNFEYGIVHCNFSLRGEESDGDEFFVCDKVKEFGVPAYHETFDTKEYAKLKGISIEMAARELRYDFFERIRIEHNYDYVATAHHQDDLIETFFLNLSRKTGIKGLTGIKGKKGTIIRPLLYAGREEIVRYAAQNDIEYREDSTNNDVIYQRNFLRHKIIPLFSELNPSFKKNFLASVENLKNVEDVYNQTIGIEIEKIVEKKPQGISISIQKLKECAFAKTVLFETLSVFGFNSTVVDEIFESLDAESGKQFFSKSHCLVKDRECLFVFGVTENETKYFYIEETDRELDTPVSLKIETFNADNFEIIRDKNIACIDAANVSFPLLIRKWKQGDYFQPLGMTGFKKISDFLIDQKIPLHEKENIWLLCSGKKIAWIIGHRLDNRFKITPKTNKILKVSFDNEIIF